MSTDHTYFFPELKPETQIYIFLPNLCKYLYYCYFKKVKVFVGYIKMKTDRFCIIRNY